MRNIALLLVSAIIFTACSTGTTPPIQPEPEVEAPVVEESVILTVGMPSLSHNYDPISTGLTNVSPLHLTCYEGLFTYDPYNGSLVPGICSEYMVSEDGLIYTFRLKENVKYSNGTTIIADHFVDTIFRLLDGEGDPAVRDKLTEMIVGASDYVLPRSEQPEGFGKEDVGVYATGGVELEIHLNSPTSEILQLLSLPALSPTYPSSTGTAPAVDPNAEERAEALFVSGGPYYIVSDDDSGITVEKNVHYYDMLNISTDNVRFIELNESSMTAYSEDRLDIIVNPSDEFLQAYSSDVVSSETFDVGYIVFNPDRSSSANSFARTAISQSIDREALADSISPSAVAATGLVPPGVVLEDRDYSNFAERNSFDTTLDADAVSESLINARYRDGIGLYMTMVVNSSDPYVEAYRLAADMIEDNTGGSLDFFVMPEQEFYETIEDGKFNFAAGFHSSDILNPASLLEIAYGYSPHNITGFYDPDYDALLEEASIQPNPLRTREALQAAEIHLIANTTFIPLFHHTQNIIVSDNVENFFLNPVGNLYLKNVSKTVEEAQ